MTETRYSVRWAVLRNAGAGLGRTDQFPGNVIHLFKLRRRQEKLREGRREVEREGSVRYPGSQFSKSHLVSVGPAGSPESGSLML